MRSVCDACTVTLAPAIEHAALPFTNSVPVPAFTFTEPDRVTPPPTVAGAEVVSAPATLSAAANTTGAEVVSAPATLSAATNTTGAPTVIVPATSTAAAKLSGATTSNVAPASTLTDGPTLDTWLGSSLSVPAATWSSPVLDPPNELPVKFNDDLEL